MAIPIISGVLGAFGVEAAKEAAGVADDVLGALFGKRASEVLEEVGARLRGYAGEVPPNHDLERTLRLIQLSTNLYLLRDYQGWEEAERIPTRTATAPLFIAAAHAWLRDQIGLCPRMTVVENAPLVAEMERALDALLRSGNPTEAARTRIAAVETAAWDELVSGAGEPPRDFRARFFGKAEGCAAWRDIFRALVREALKDKPRVKIAFDISRLAALREETTAIGQAVAALSGDTGALRATMETLSRDVGAIRSQLHRNRRLLPFGIAGGAIGLVVLIALIFLRPVTKEDLNVVAGPILDGTTRIESAQENAARLAEARYVETLAAITRDKGVPLAALAAILRRMGEEGVPDSEIEARLAAKADEYVALRAELTQARDSRPDSARARAEASTLLAEGDFSAARAALSRGRGQLRALREQTAREEASLAGEEARIARLDLQYRAAAGLYREAASRVAFDEGAAWTWLRLAANSLVDQGSEFGDNDALQEAIAVYGEALHLAPRDRVPLNWAVTQNDLGIALGTLGERESGTARLEEAIAVFRLTLEETRRDGVPNDWAGTQNNLGTALQILGRREGGTARLEEAVAAYRLGLEEFRRDRVPLDWAATQNNLGTALATLGGRAESGTARLEEAVAAHRLALEERQRDRVPLDWANTQHNLGRALHLLGARESGTARLEEAVAAYRLALEEHRRDRAPFLWARTMENLAWVEETLGTRETPRQHWQSALDHLRAALEEYVRAGADFDIARATALRDRLLARLASLP